MRQFLCDFLMLVSLLTMYVMVVFSMAARHFKLDAAIKERVNYILDLVLATIIFVALVLKFLL